MKIIQLASVANEGVSHNPEIKKKVMLRKGDLPHLTALTQSRLLPGQATSGHKHTDMFEVFFIQQGIGLIRINGLEHPLEPEVCVAVEPGEVHEIANIGSDDLILVYFGVEV